MFQEILAQKPDGLHRAKVLCIDDDPEVSRLIGVRLESDGVEVIRAFHGNQGVWLAITERPNVIVTDLRMPQGHGQYVVECLKNNAETKAIPIVVFTGLRNHNVRSQLRRLGVEAVFNKPAPIEALRRCIEKLIDCKVAVGSRESKA